MASSSSSWACSRCSFLNPPSQKSACQICLSPSPLLSTTTITSPAVAVAPPPSSSSSPSSSPLRWSCRACTFSNPFDSVACEICGTRSTLLLYSGGGLDDDLMDSSDLVGDPGLRVGSVFCPLRRCSVKRAPLEASGADISESAEHRPGKSLMMEAAAPVSGNVDLNTNLNLIKVLSYNVWFREDLEVYKRMKALGDLIQQHSPDLICFQEVTPNIYVIFRNSSWWKEYRCSVSEELASKRPYFCMQMSRLPVKAFSCKPFGNSMMGRELCIADVDVGMGRSLVVATSHLESPCPAPPKWDQMYSRERVAQAKESLRHIKDLPNAIFGGDMNWDDKLDGAFPLPEGWVDAWLELRPKENGWTYDTKANQMLSGNRTLQKRLDRIMCNLRDFKIISIDMIGLEALPGLSYTKEKKVRNELKKLVLPVLPSDHYGLLLTINIL